MQRSFTHSGNIILAGFGFMIIMMSVLVYKCLQQNVGMVGEGGDYYRQELNYQQKINAAAKTQGMPDSFKISQQQNELVFSVPASLVVDSVTLSFYCNADNKQDKKLSVKEAGRSFYSFDISSWKKTGYTLKADIYSKGEYYYQQQKIEIQ